MRATPKSPSASKPMFGVDEVTYNRKAEMFSKSAIIWWLVAGYGYGLFSGKLNAWSGWLLFFPGIFVISFASIPFFLLKLKKIKDVTALDDRAKAQRFLTGRENLKEQTPFLIFYTLTSIISFLFPIIAAILFVYIARNW